MSRARDDWARLLTWVLAVALVVAFVGVIYVSLTASETTDPYTEFYVLGPDGNASGYPTNLTVGESGELVVGITNHEHEDVTYTVVLQLSNRSVGERTVAVRDRETWERPFSFTAEEAGEHELDVLLYRGDEVGPAAAPYRELRLLVNVSATGS